MSKDAEALTNNKGKPNEKRVKRSPYDDRRDPHPSVAYNRKRQAKAPKSHQPHQSQHIQDEQDYESTDQQDAQHTS